MYLSVVQIPVQKSLMVKVEFVPGELIKKADTANTRFFFSHTSIFLKQFESFNRVAEV